MNQDEIYLRILEGVIDLKTRLVRLEMKVDSLADELAGFKAEAEESLTRIDHEVAETLHTGHLSLDKPSGGSENEERRSSIWADLIDH